MGRAPSCLARRLLTSELHCTSSHHVHDGSLIPGFALLLVRRFASPMLAARSPQTRCTSKLIVITRTEETYVSVLHVVVDQAIDE